ncbi:MULTISPECIES: recombinase family protein [unclassified Microbacterium]|uniref:recombinase family protein n=1 Tax=unclassified Microbacterium TaxID=2609290 RepID=UPI001BB2272F|nr:MULTISPECIES: recombinase family protein [unclassified Microbacterium]
MVLLRSSSNDNREATCFGIHVTDGPASWRVGLEEGLSIPAQREAAQRKADQLNAVIVAEFIEPGESGKTARRKALQEMLDYLAEHLVRYCIINKVDPRPPHRHRRRLRQGRTRRTTHAQPGTVRPHHHR